LHQRGFPFFLNNRLSLRISIIPRFFVKNAALDGLFGLFADPAVLADVKLQMAPIGRFSKLQSI